MGPKSYSYYRSYGVRLWDATWSTFNPGVESSEAPRGPFGRPCLLCDIFVGLGVAEDQGRIVRNEHFVALVPWWAVWPFELLGE